MICPFLFVSGFCLFVFGCTVQLEPGPPLWKHWVLTTGRPGNSPSIVESGVLESLTVIDLLSISPFKSVSICLIYLANLFRCWVHIYLQLLYPLYHYIMIFFVSCYICWLKVYFFWYKYSSLQSFGFHLHLFPFLHFEPLYVHKAEVSLL